MVIHMIATSMATSFFSAGVKLQKGIFRYPKRAQVLKKGNCLTAQIAARYARICFLLQSSYMEIHIVAQHITCKQPNLLGSIQADAGFRGEDLYLVDFGSDGTFSTCLQDSGT